MSEMKNVFISHIHEDDEAVRGLRELLDGSGSTIRNSAIDSSKPNDAKDEEYIKYQVLAPGINWAGAVVVLISPNTHKSWWVDWEIEYAEKQGKRIVGVFLQGAKDSDVPSALDLYADAVVGWQADRVMEAINGKTNNWYTAAGQERPERQIKRIRCQ